VKVNQRKEVNIQDDITGSWLELDVWIPQLNLAFEYQDRYHFKTAVFSDGPQSKYDARDSTKRMKVLEQGITLVHVPYWWNRTSERYNDILY